GRPLRRLRWRAVALTALLLGAFRRRPECGKPPWPKTTSPCLAHTKISPKKQRGGDHLAVTEGAVKQMAP
ncbi:hypothetical protein HPB47_010134, partial [Ixodes persulcatus]